jgi:SAM-dependent methyltransferase
MKGGSIPYVCPRCREGVVEREDGFECLRCPARYPRVAGIPDFRLEPDPWIDLEADRSKALKVEEAGRGLDFEGMVRAYWRLTPATPAPQAERFVAHVLRAERRSHEWLRRLGPDAAPESGPWLDDGCGTADLASATAGTGTQVACLDVAIRWLVVARRRLEERGVSPWLVCANAEHLPFPDASFGRVFSLGLLEHCGDAGAVLEEARRVLVPGGVLRARTVNRYSLLGEPHVGVWGVGFLPRAWADGYVRWRTGAGYRHHRLLGPVALRRAMARAGLRGSRVSAASFLSAEAGDAAWLTRLGPAYDALSRTAPFGQLLKWVSPVLDARGVA